MGKSVERPADLHMMTIFLSVASMAEEVRDPSITVPKAIIWSIPFGLICGLCFYLPIVFTLPDMQLLLAGACVQELPPMNVIDSDSHRT